MSAADYSLLDNTAISMNSFYPRRDWTATPQGAQDHTIAMEDGVELSCRFFPVGQGTQAGNESPTVLFFYGNGETAVGYDTVAPLYNRIGTNFFVADYRGYGRSGGNPAFNAMLSDAHSVLEGLSEVLKEGRYTGGIFVMGRSMGRHAAFEIAANSPEGVQGMIVESGRPSLGQFVYGLEEPAARELETDYRAKVASISIPALVIHGELDNLAPLGQAVSMFESLASSDKRILTIPGAGHNDLMYVGINEYFAAIRDFLAVDPSLHLADVSCRQ